MPSEREGGRGKARTSTSPSPNVTPQSPEDDDRKVRRREKNRVAAQRSRKKQTQKADKLHEVRLWFGSTTGRSHPGDNVAVVLSGMHI